jgi:hypothetical protein
MEAALIATLWVLVVTNIAVGWVAYQAAMESRRCRAETHTARLALLEVLNLLIDQREARRREHRESVVVHNPFANWVGSALANYEAQFYEEAA